MATEIVQPNDTQIFDSSVNVLRALLWQHENATALQALLSGKQAWLNANQQQFWEDFLTNIFDMRTANEFGLAVWSIILDLPLFISSGASPTSKPAFGFGTANYPFGVSNFSTATGGTSALPLETKRLALRLRYFQICSSGTVPEINRFLKVVFAPYGTAYLADNHDMTQQYYFNFDLTPDLIYLFENIDILPRPAGVLSRYLDATRIGFGFGNNQLNFNNGFFEA